VVGGPTEKIDQDLIFEIPKRGISYHLATGIFTRNACLTNVWFFKKIRFLHLPTVLLIIHYLPWIDSSTILFIRPRATPIQPQDVSSVKLNTN
jgi:hypothetical protein